MPKHLLNDDKASGGCLDFELFKHNSKSRRNYAEAKLIYGISKVW